jgi:hypothetical protein
MQRANWQLVLLGWALAGCSANPAEQGPERVDSLGESAKVTLPESDISAVGLDCSSFNGYTAALATSTVDCLGTIRPDAFKVTADGFLARNFSSCSLDATRLSAIDAVLSLQHRAARLPHVKECIAGRYADFKRGFVEAGIAACPSWSKEQTVNPITTAVIEKLTPALVSLHEEQLKVADKSARKALELTAGGVPEELEEKNLYTVSFPASASEQMQASAAAWAAGCAGGFAGFVLGTAGSSVLTDPVAWLLDNTYSSAAADPFLRATYYHPMSHYGGPPGVMFGDANRFAPCPGCRPETCSYFAGSHLKTYLQLDCLDESDWNTCVSYCGPKLP